MIEWLDAPNAKGYWWLQECGHGLPQIVNVWIHNGEMNVSTIGSDSDLEATKESGSKFPIHQRFRIGGLD